MTYSYLQTLVDKLFERVIFLQDQQVYLDIARAYYAVDCVAHAQKYMEHLLARPHFLDVAEAWYLYGLFLSVCFFILLEALN